MHIYVHVGSACISSQEVNIFKGKSYLGQLDSSKVKGKSTSLV